MSLNVKTADCTTHEEMTVDAVILYALIAAKQVLLSTSQAQ